MTYVVVYDIHPAGIRNRLAKALEGFGQRVQESVFECRLDHELLAEMIERLKQELRSAEAGNIRIYRVCADCLRASVGLGPVVSTMDSEPCIIL